MKFLFIAFVFGLAAATHKKPLSVLNVYGVSPSEVARERVRETEFCTEEGCRKVVLPVTEFITQKVLGLRDVFEKPLFVLTPNREHPEELTAHYVAHGLRSIRDVTIFKGLNEYLKTPGEQVGLLFYPKGVYNTRFFETNIHHNVIIPEEFKVGDFLKAVSDVEEEPFLLVTSKDFFDKLHFTALKEVARFGVYDDVIEPLPDTTPLLV